MTGWCMWWITRCPRWREGSSVLSMSSFCLDRRCMRGCWWRLRYVCRVIIISWGDIRKGSNLVNWLLRQWLPFGFFTPKTTDRICFALIAIAALYFLAEGAETSCTSLSITASERRKGLKSFFSLGILIAHV